MFKESHWRPLRSAPPETHCRGHPAPPEQKACALGPLSLFQREEEVEARPVDPPTHTLWWGRWELKELAEQDAMAWPPPPDPGTVGQCVWHGAAPRRVGSRTINPGWEAVDYSSVDTGVRSPPTNWGEPIGGSVCASLRSVGPSTHKA